MSIGNLINKSLLSQSIPPDLKDKAASAVVTSTNPAKEELTYLATIGGSTIPISHPYLGPNSWLRIMPEQGTSCMIARRAENGEPYVSAYFRGSISSAETYTRATQQDKFYYKPLQEGEIDMATQGIANVYLSKRGTLELRGGSTSVKLHADRGEIEARSPTHLKAILGNKRQAVGDEERFGVIQRPGALNKTFPGQTTIRNIVETTPGFFAKEYLRNIKSEGPVANLTLIDHREGDVYDDSGTELKASTGKKLRSVTKYGTEIPSVYMTTEVDVDGNIAVTLPRTAVQGLNVSAEAGHAKFTVGQDFSAVAKQSVLLSGADLDFKAKASTVLTSPTVEVKSKTSTTVVSPSIKLGSKQASHPAVHGDVLTQWLVKEVITWAGLITTKVNALPPTSTIPPLAILPSMLSSKVTLD